MTENNDALSQEEIDALLDGVDDGSIDTSQQSINSDEAVPFDLTCQERVVRGRFPTLDVINEKFARQSRVTWFNTIQQSVDVVFQGVQMTKFADYMKSLPIPTSLNLIKLNPLRGTALLIFDAKLVYLLVENFFGGNGLSQFKSDTREFTATEIRIVCRMIDLIFKDLEESWEPVFKIDCEYVSSETNPIFANIINPSDLIVLSKFQIEVLGIEGTFQLAIPYAMLEPIKELLDVVVQSESGETDPKWMEALRNEILDVKMDVSSVLTEAVVSLNKLNSLEKGSVIPVRMPEHATVFVDGVATHKAKYGVSGGNIALKIEKQITKGSK